MLDASDTVDRWRQERDPLVLMTMYYAVGARHGLQRLHEQGAFTDEEAPALNRALRTWIFSLLTLLHLSEFDDEGTAHDLLLRLAGDTGDDDLMGQMMEADHLYQVTLPRACAQAVREFCEGTGKDETVQAALADAAGREARQFVDWSMASVDGDQKAADRVAIGLQLIPDYWERPELLDEVSALKHAAA